MPRTSDQLRRDALAIWMAGLDAVRSDRLVREHVRLSHGRLLCGPESIDLAGVGRILVVGAGKAGAGMAAGLETALGPGILADKHVSGWIHVPDNCVRKLSHVHLHAARPAGVNEPTQAGVDGARQMLRLAAALSPEDLCIALISGGGSALLPDPISGVSLADKLAVTRFLSAAGAPIEHLNAVRKALSQIKGGGLARACGAGRLVTLVISDVLGDPLEVIASGPTVAERASPEQAIALLEQYGAREAGISPGVFEALARREAQADGPIRCQVTNLVIGNNATAVAGATAQAQRLGYTASSESARGSEGPAEEVGARLAAQAQAMRAGPGADALISGGEPTVRLVEESLRGKGGRNQQLVLAAAVHAGPKGAEGTLILSGGTDGEDGPTDAAGAWTDSERQRAAQQLHLDGSEYLARNDAYHYFEPLEALIKTGPTDTNVCDVRVVLVDRVATEAPSS
ncbi:MAG: glycerate kinase [Pirellulales bacterium]